MESTDTARYRERKAFFDRLLTIYGRKPVVEALQDHSVPVYKLHMADSNRRDGVVARILSLAEQRQIPVEFHNRDQLARISRNKKQDQGVAADLSLSGYQQAGQFLSERNRPFQLLAVDGITNPQNLGMIIRTVCASRMDGLIIPKRGCAELSPLVIKASAGTLFRARLLHCETLAPVLEQCRQLHADICILDGTAKNNLFDFQATGSCVYVLGNETDGVSRTVRELATKRLRVPMHNQVESLNVAITAALVAFRQPLAGGGEA